MPHNEQLNTEKDALIQRRNLLESQPIEVLLGTKNYLLNRISEAERDVHMINDIIDMYTPDGQAPTTEYPQDSRWL